MTGPYEKAIATHKVSMNASIRRAQREAAAHWSTQWNWVSGPLERALQEVYDTYGGTPTRRQLSNNAALQKALRKLAVEADTNMLNVSKQLRVTLEKAVLQGSESTRLISRAAVGGFSDHLPVTKLDPIQRAAQRAMQVRIDRVVNDVMAAVRTEVLRSRTVKQAMRGIAQRYDMLRWKSQTIARTEAAQAHRAGALAYRKEHRDEYTGWVWMSSLDSHTCPECRSHHGEFFSSLEIGPNAHPNCRCFGVPVPKGVDAPMLVQGDGTPVSIDTLLSAEA